jgi:hypothetical protein
MPIKIRPIRVDGDVAYVTLTQGYVAVIDAVDVPLVEGRNWYVHKNQCGNIYARNGTHPNRIHMHRVILNCAVHMQTDHIDGDGLNNRRCNLRQATCAQNIRNQGIAKHNTSGFKGASWHNLRSKWQAHIQVNNRSKHLGCFSTPEDAHAAYCEASAKYHGEFGRTE